MSPPGLVDNLLHPGVAPSLRVWAARRPLDRDEMATVVSSVGFTFKMVKENKLSSTLRHYSVITESDPLCYIQYCLWRSGILVMLKQFFTTTNCVLSYLYIRINFLTGDIRGMELKVKMTSGQVDSTDPQGLDSLLQQSQLQPLGSTMPFDLESGVTKTPVCDQCGKTFKHMRNIKRHLQAFHQMYVLPCEHCTKYFSRTDKLRAHLRDVHGIGEKLVCRRCKQHFPGEIYLEKHYSETGHDED